MLTLLLSVAFAQTGECKITPSTNHQTVVNHLYATSPRQEIGFVDNTGHLTVNGVVWEDPNRPIMINTGSNSDHSRLQATVQKDGTVTQWWLEKYTQGRKVHADTCQEVLPLIQSAIDDAAKRINSPQP